MMTLSQFWQDVDRMYAGHLGHRMRYGQVAFNMLNDVRPELASLIRGTDVDPFYSGQFDTKFVNFCTWLLENW